MGNVDGISWRWQKQYDKDSKDPFVLSRTKVDMFVECKRCFFLDRKLGVKRPSMPAFTLNVAVDGLLKKEFDSYRAKNEKHPLMESYGIDARPVDHEELPIWRENFEGVQYYDKKHNLIFTGAIDDLWINDAGEYVVVDYKATAKDGEINLDDQWKVVYKRQMEFYQWLLRNKGYKVSNTGYFVYVNGKTDKKAFDAKLEFDVQIIPYTGDSSWVDKTVNDLHELLQSDEIPGASSACEYCAYRDNAGKAFKEIVNKTKK